MDAETLIHRGTDPDAWFAKSRSLRTSGNILWDAFITELTTYAVAIRDNDLQANMVWDRASELLTSAKMLYGLSAETAFKGTILRDRPADVQFHMEADGQGTIQRAELKQLGVSMGAGHDLVRLAEKAGAFRRGTGEVFPEDSDYVAIRAILEDLGQIVVWAGRYPVPLRSGTTPEVPMGIPAKVFGHYLRDWLDVLLDRYVAPSKGSQAQALKSGAQAGGPERQRAERDVSSRDTPS